ncbi:MAG: EutN/CcmL family microcompartment protein [Candidatus Sumerlaeaceae bacterium]
MFLGKVIGNVVSSDKHDAYQDRKLLMVQKLDLYQNASGPSTIAIDYVGAGEGDIVLVGAAPGLASNVFGIPKAPIRELVMGVVDRVQTAGKPQFGNSVAANP